LLIGLAGLLTPQDFAASLQLSLDNPEGAGSVRAMIGAHYVAMGSVCLFASFRARPGLLWPVAAIEIAMVFARLLTKVVLLMPVHTQLLQSKRWVYLTG